MHPHPQDGSPGSFPDAGCVTNHLGLIGIRTCGSYGNVNAIRLYSIELIAIKLFHYDWARNAPTPSGWVPRAVFQMQVV